MIFPEKDWMTKTFEQANINEEIVGKMFGKLVDLNWNVHSLMLVVDGYKIFEEHAHPFERRYPRETFSASKAFLSAAVAMLIKEGKLNLQDKIIDYFADEIKPYKDQIHHYYNEMTLRNIIMMATGQTIEDCKVTANESDWIKAFFTTNITHEPGTVFRYGGHTTYVISTIIKKITGMRLLDYLDKYLFSKIGIAKTLWRTHDGVDIGAYGYESTTDGLARLALLFLNYGEWNGEQLLDRQYCVEASQKQIDVIPLFEDWEGTSYTYHLWTQDEIGGYKGSGTLGQTMMMLPNQNAVFIIQSGETENVALLTRDFIVPAIEKGYEGPSESLVKSIEKFRLPAEEKSYLPPVDAKFNYSYKLSEKVELKGCYFNTDEIGFEYDGKSLAFIYDSQKYLCGLDNRFLETTVMIPICDNLTERHMAYKADFADDNHLSITCQPLETPWRGIFNIEFLDAGKINAEIKIYEKCDETAPKFNVTGTKI